MRLNIICFIHFYIGILSVEALSCDYKSPTEKICRARDGGTIEQLRVIIKNPVSNWSTERRDTYKIKVEKLFSRVNLLETVDDIIVIDCPRKLSLDCQMSITVGKTYLLATLIEEHKDKRKVARKIRDLCYTWYMDVEEVNIKQLKWLQEVHENCKKCIRLPKTNCIPFPESSSEKGSEKWLIILAIVFGSLFGVAIIIIIIYLLPACFDKLSGVKILRKLKRNNTNNTIHTV